MNSSDDDVVNGIEHINLASIYLGILQSSGPHTDAVVEKVFNECLRWANIVWSSALSGLHKAKAHNTYVGYPCCKLCNVCIEDSCDHHMRFEYQSLISFSSMQCPSSPVSRLYLPCYKGGRGLLSFEHFLNERLLVDLCCYVPCPFYRGLYSLCYEP